MKYWISLLFVVSMLLMTAGIASAATVTVTPKLILDGQQLAPKQPPSLIDGRVMLPVRIVGESLGYSVVYEGKKKAVTVKNGDSTIVMTVGSKKATVNGKSVTLDTPPLMKSDITMIPLYFVSANFGVEVIWDNKTKSAFMYTSGTGGSGNGGTVGNGGNGGDGGLVGEVDPTPTPTPTATPSPTPTPTPVPTPTPSTSPEQTPVPATSTVQNVRFENDSVILKYDGVIAPVITTLGSPNRIVVDLPGTDYAVDFQPALSVDASKTGSLGVTGHAALTQVRFSLYSDNPKTVRFVLDLSQKWNFEVQDDPVAKELRILLKQPQANVFTVVLDAGHGGSDPGALSITKKTEKSFNLAVILKLQALLMNDPRLNIVMTRSSDTFPSLSDRYNLANSLNADLFLSVHGNSNTKNTISGTEVYYSRPESLAFANVVQQYGTPSTGLSDRGVIKKSLAVTRETKMPAVLFEAGYLSNASDEKKMYTEDFQNQVAQGLATAIKVYLNLQ